MGDPVIGGAMPNKPSIIFRRTASMGNALMKNNPEDVDSSTWLAHRLGFYKCASCKACQFGVNTKTYQTAFSSKIHTISKYLSCKTEFAVYALICSCNFTYIGSTKLPVHKRILQHTRGIVNKDPNYPVARHFKEYHQSSLKYFKYYVLDTVPFNKRGGNREARLRRLETRYILELDTKQPRGLNTSEDLYTYL